MKRVKLFSVVILIGIVIFGLQELSYKNDVFAESLLLCCNNNLCEYPNDCSKGSSVQLKIYNDANEEIECTEDYTINCFQCVDLSASGQVCKDPLSSCSNNGSCYGWCYTPGIGWGWILQK